MVIRAVKTSYGTGSYVPVKGDAMILEYPQECGALEATQCMCIRK